MSLEDNKYYKIYKKHEKFIHFIEGVCIIILLVFIWVLYYQQIQLEKEISENCGWEGKDYECYCQKSDAIALKNQLNNDFELDIDIEDVDS